MRRRKRILPALGSIFLLFGAAQVAGMVHTQPTQAGEAVQDTLLAGCTDIPEAVDLASLIKARSDAMARLADSLEQRKQDIAAAEGSVTAKLRQLKAAQDTGRSARTTARKAVTDDIDRLVGVYDAMKPREAAAVLSSLPPDFAAEILMRVDPETGAAILASVEPAQAAILTTHMGARRVRQN